METDRLRWSVADTISDTTLYQSMRMHFQEDIPWKETELFIELRKNLSKYGHAFHGCETEAQILERFDRLDGLYEQIARDGYKTQRELAQTTGQKQGWGFIDEFAHEILVDIGRDGELLFVDGRHRLCLAKILELETIPVAFRVRHTAWMQKRPALVKERVTHPDLREHYRS